MLVLLVGLVCLSTVYGDCSKITASTFFTAKDGFLYVKEWGPRSKFSVMTGDLVVEDGGQVMLSNNAVHKCVDNGWELGSLSEFNKVPEVYHLEQSGRHPLRAVQFCKDLGGTLVTVDGPEHNQILVLFMELANVMFTLIGYTDLVKEGDWTWLDGSESVWTNWYPNQPNNAQNGEDMAVIMRRFGGLWFDIGPPKDRNTLINGGRNLIVPFWCQMNTLLKPAIPVRLRDTLDKKAFNNDRGLVEVYVDGNWGTVCQNEFDDSAAKVVCGMLGNARGGARITAQFLGTDAILFDDLSCSGDEKSLFDCPHSELNRHGCIHSQDVWIECFGERCPVGRFSNSVGVCEKCRPGYFNRWVGRDFCRVCGPGTFQPRSGGRQCIRCPVGSDSELEYGSTNCEQCPPGTTQVERGERCQACPRGTYNPVGGSSACRDCLMGTYQDELGGAGCKICPSGTSSPGSADCEQAVVVKHECGKRQMGFKDGEGRIVGGELANEGEYPWQVLIGSRMGFIDFCGGTLIDHDTIITAAHCTHNAYMGLICTNPLSRGMGDECPWRDIEDLTVTIGLTDKYNEAELEVAVQASVSAIYVAKSYGYISGILRDDIAILKLDRSVAYTDRIQPACMPEKDLKFKSFEALTVTGFGYIRENGFVSEKLRKVNVPYVPTLECNKVMDNNVKENMFCAGFRAGRKDACQGDSGGPIGREDRANNKFTLVGVISWGQGCARENKYGVYTDLSKMLGFVEDVKNYAIEPVAVASTALPVPRTGG